MSLMLFIIRKSLKNLFKGAFKKPIILIGYIVVLLLIIAFIASAFLMPSGNIRKADPKLFTGIVFLVFLFMYYTTLKIGIDKGSTFFRMSDVNLAFTSPVRANHILLYAFIKQIGSTFLFLFVATCQIQNIKNNFELIPSGIVRIPLSVAAYALSYPLLSMIIYSWASKKNTRKKLLTWIFNAIALAVVGVFLINIVQTRNFLASLDAVFNNPVARYFPVVGWTSSIASSAVLGFTTEFYIGSVCMLILILGLSVALYKMNLDYYEDVLVGTEYIEAALKAKREGTSMTFGVKAKNKVRQSLWGYGAKAVFSRQLLEMRKASFFLFFDRASIIVIISAIVYKYIMPQEAGQYGFLLILGFAVYMLLLFQVQGRLNIEMDRPYIFLIPASSPKKLFYTTLSEHVKNLFDGTILFILAGIILNGEFSIVLASIFAYVSFGAVYVYTDVLSRRLFGWIHSKGMLIFAKAIAAILIQVPGIIMAVITAIVTHNEFWIIIALGGWSFILASTLFIFSAGILNNLESAG